MTNYYDLDKEDYVEEIRKLYNYTTDPNDGLTLDNFFSGIVALLSEAYDEGYEEGYSDGYEEGYNTGYDEGFSEGYAEELEY